MIVSLVSFLAFLGVCLAGPVAPSPSVGPSASGPVAKASSGPVPFGIALHRDAGRARPHARPSQPVDRYPEIDQIALRVWTVERALVESYAGDLDALDGLARARRHRFLGGEIDGYYIDRVRRTNPLYDAGIRNGDVIHSVNGDPLRNAFQVFWAFRKHRKAEVIQVELTRRDGRRLTLTYLIG